MRQRIDHIVRRGRRGPRGYVAQRIGTHTYVRPAYTGGFGLSLSPSRITVTIPHGSQSAVVQKLTVGATDEDGKLVPLKITKTGAWLSVTPGTSDGSPTQITVTIDPSTISGVDDDYTATITVAPTTPDPAIPPRTIPVTATVLPEGVFIATETGGIVLTEAQPGRVKAEISS